MSTAEIEAEVRDLIEAHEHGAGEGRPLDEFLGMTCDELLLYLCTGILPRDYVPPVRLGPLSRPPLRPIDAPDSESIADHLRHYDPRGPLAMLILTLLGGGCLVGIILWIFREATK